jgi:TetR/AcrR family transcriptional regulator, copper-responsive repressor
MSVQNSDKRRRGRPRTYDPDVALRKATEVFWDLGYSGASLEDLGGAMQMNRPSMYAAFGDKHALYLKTLASYRAMARHAMQQELSYEIPFAEALRRVYDRAISIYTGGRKRRPGGCFLIGTAATEAVTDPEVRKALADGLHELDGQLESRIRHAVKQGDLTTHLAPPELARLACGIMNSLAVRARAGEPRSALRTMADAAVLLICGPPR